MSDLGEFLLARIAEEEDLARAALRLGGTVVDADPPSSMPPTAWWGIDRVLAECSARRRIVELCLAKMEFGSADDGQPLTSGADLGVDVLEVLALPYADQPEFDPAWRA